MYWGAFARGSTHQLTRKDKSTQRKCRSLWRQVRKQTTNIRKYRRYDVSGANICRVGQNRIYTPYMTVYFVITLPKIPYIHRIYMVLANPKHMPSLYPACILVSGLLGCFLLTFPLGCQSCEPRALPLQNLHSHFGVSGSEGDVW